LPSSPLPAVITCIATAPFARGQGLAQALVQEVVADLEGRGFSAIETYPDLTLAQDHASAANPAFWESCGFMLAAADERYPVMRRDLE
jgi:ribosomal protein S18 acetylase RimI-like enzyme